LLNQLPADYHVREGKFHIAGTFNGGIGASHIAASWPQYFLSVTGFSDISPTLQQPAFARSKTCASICTSGSWDKLMPEKE
jgi:S-formylglutathione hydrolase FrmB